MGVGGSRETDGRLLKMAAAEPGGFIRARHTQQYRGFRRNYRRQGDGVDGIQSPRLLRNGV